MSGRRRLAALALTAGLATSVAQSTVPAGADGGAGRRGSGDGGNDQIASPNDDRRGRDATTTSEHPPEREVTSTTTSARTPGVIALLDDLSARLGNSTVDEMTRTTLLARLAVLRAQFVAGDAPGQDELGRLVSAVQRALHDASPDDRGTDDGGTDDDASDDHRSDGEGDGMGSGRSGQSGAPGSSRPAGTVPVGTITSGPPSTDVGGERRGPTRAVEQLDAAKERIRNSDLAPDVKQRVLDALTETRTHLTDGAGSGADTEHAAAERVRAVRAAKLEQVRAKLSALGAKLAERVSAAEDRGTLSSADAAGLRDRLDVLASSLAGAEGIDELKAAKSTLQGIRRDLGAALEKDGSTSSATSTTSTTAATTTTDGSGQ